MADAHSRPACRGLTLLPAGYKIPKGTNMIASFWAMHRNESLWPGANEFQPERWLDDSPKAVEQRQMAWKAFGELSHRPLNKGSRVRNRWK